MPPVLLYRPSGALLNFNASGGFGTFTVQIAKSSEVEVTGVYGTSNLDNMTTSRHSTIQMLKNLKNYQTKPLNRRIYYTNTLSGNLIQRHPGGINQ